MKKLLLSTICLLFCMFICSTVSFALTINQDTETGSAQIQSHEPIGQSFTATDTNIGYVGLMISPYNQNYNDLSLTMSIFSGSGDFSSGALLATNSFSLSSGYEDWLDLDVSAVSFAQNEVYTIGIFNDTPQWGVDLNWGENPYSGGVAYYLGSAHPNSDLRFRVGESEPVPEPTTMLLFGLGLLGLAGVSRKK